MRARTLIIYISLLLVITISPAQAYEAKWLNKLVIPKECRKIIDQRINKYEGNKSVEASLKRMAHAKPMVDEFCADFGLDPSPVYGLFLTESGVRKYIIDYIYMKRLSSKAHVGYGQLNYMRLPEYQRKDPLRIFYALMYQATHNKKFLNEWMKRDIRFNPRWNAKQTIREFKGHMERTGDPTLAFMAHHGGSNDPISAVRLYAKDHGVRLSKEKVRSYVVKHQLNTLLILVDQGSAREYWSKKSDKHVTYVYSPIVWSELFARWCKRNGVNNAPIMVAKNKKIQNKNVAAVSMAAMSEGGTKKVENFEAVFGFIKDFIFQLLKETLHLIESNGILLFKWSIVIILVASVFVGLRYIVPFLFFAFMAFLKWLWNFSPRFFTFVWRVGVALMGSKKARQKAWLTLKPKATVSK